MLTKFILFDNIQKRIEICVFLKKLSVGKDILVANDGPMIEKNIDSGTLVIGD